MIDSVLKRIERNRKEHKRWIAMILCLSLVVSFGTFAGLRKDAIAKTYTRQVLECPYTAEGAERVAHTHNADCYDESGNLVCTLPELEAHTHSDACYLESVTLVCGLEENPGHVHSDDCYTAEISQVCTLEESEGHQHSEDCYILERGELICDNTNEEHEHSDECFAWNEVLSCGMEAGEGSHVHSDECFQTEWVLTCGMEEGEGTHSHTDACYEAERILICEEEELPVHIHDAGCFRTEEITVDDEPEEQENETTENVTPEMPVSDPNADLETQDIWERDFDDLELSGNWATDLIAVAATQQGKGESSCNFLATLNDAGDTWGLDGYTRYGAWYGTPYAEWSALFVSFCLRYAGIPEENVPTNPTAALMAESFDQGELFAGADYTPTMGDLVFFDTDDEEGIDRMGIVYFVDEEEGSINTVEGDHTNMVETFGYYLNDDSIVGYGILPQNPDYVPTDDLIVMTEEDGEEKEEDAEPEEAKTEETETEVTEITAPAVPMPAQSFEKLAGGIKVSVEAPEGAFPENTRMSASPVNGNNLKGTVADAVNGEILEVQAVDIKFYDAEGNEIEPAIPIRVTLTPWASAHEDQTTQVVHIDKAGDAEVIEQAADAEPAGEREVVFDADSFSIYAIVYSVSFEYEVDGQVFTSSVPGAKEILLSDVLKELNVTAEDKIADFMSRIAEVSVSAPDVLSITAAETDWTIVALKASEEVAFLTVTMNDGAVFSIAVKADGTTEVSSEDESAVISTADDRYLPEDASARAEVLDEEKSESAIAAVQELEETQGAYHVFNIALENVDVEAYDGFNVSVTLPEDAVVGKDFQLYQIREDETVNLTESLEVTGEQNENGLQNVSGFSFKTDDFADFVLSYSIETNYTAFDGKTYKISLNYGPEAEIPEGAELMVEEILPETEDYTQYLNDSVTELGVKSGAVSFARFFDIEIRKDGEKIEPKAPVSVKIQMISLPEETENAEAQVIHFGEQTEVLDTAVDGTDVSFETGSFSVYGVVYTVDFHYEINGESFEFSIPGGEFISLEHLIEALGINVSDAVGTANVPAEEAEEETAETSVETVAEEIKEATATETEAAADDENSNVNVDAEVDTAVAFEQAISLNSIPVSEATRAFVADIATVEFSSPELVWVGKVEEESTVGALKEANGLEVEYSANLTEEQIAEINAQTVEAGDWALVSVRPFVSEENLTVTMKNGDSFTIRVTDGQIRKTVIDAKGDTWEITVTYGDDAQIPDGAELKVEEILPENEAYEQYYQQASEVALGDAERWGIELPVVDGMRMFDIEIHGEEGKIEPAAPVQVDIRLVSTTAELLSVVHFAENGAESMSITSQQSVETAAEAAEQPAELMAEALADTESMTLMVTNDATALDTNEFTAETADKSAVQAVNEVRFTAQSFSVYTVVSVNDDNLAQMLADGPYALVTGIANDPGATTGYDETWGRDYFTIIVNANAMTDKAVTHQGNNVAFTAEGVHAWTDGSNSYVGGEVPECWEFEPVPNSNKYYIKKTGTNQYIDHHYGNQETCSLSTQWKTEFTIDRNSDGTVSIYNGDWYLCNNGSGEWGSRDFRFQTNVAGQDRAKFRLCKASDDFDSFAAKKVSAADLTAENTFLIYRKFVDEKGNEQLYALASDGTFVRVYDGGDSVYWRETDKNVYWNYLKDGNYYSIFSENPATNQRVYINPMDSTHQTITPDASHLTLVGKDTGEYSTAIEDWDQTAYDYAGLHVTVDNQGVAHLDTGTRVVGTSDEFLFAVASSMPSSTPVPVATVDSDSLGIKITMFDYGDAKTEYSAGTKLSGMTNTVGTGSDGYTPHEAHALVKPYLESGLPSGSAGAMRDLFSTGGSQVTAYRENVNHLFLQSYYDENGMFRYRSEDNYAYLPFNPDGSNSGNRITSNDFIVYQQAATPYTTDTQPGHTYYYHGHFMPFNEIDTTQHVGRLMNQYGNAYDPETGEIIGEIPLGDGRTYEEIYGVQGTPNFYTGMRMEANFTQPRNGKLENGDDMIFKFSGDDDMWVYIDGVLVLDIGGIHEPLSGTINFATGVVTNPTGSSLAGTTTLREIFMNVLHDSSTPESVKEKIRAIQWDGDTFADYTNHSFSAFYMERGAGASNLDIQFNLKVVLTNQFIVQKEIPENVDDRFDNQAYKFRATYMDGTTEKPLHAGIDNVCTSVVYKDKKDDQGNPVPVSVDNDGYFTLRAGEAAVFMMADESIKFNVKEVDLNQYNLEKITINGDEVTEHVEINDQQATITDNAAVAGYDEVGDRSNVLYTNYPKTQNLLITKHISVDSAPLVEGENPVFEFRVYLETTETNEDGTTQRKLVPYSYGPYYLTKKVDDATHYFTLTGVNNAPVDKGTEPVVCSTTGRSGSINSIPPEYTIVIPNLVVGTNFYVEERRDNIPEGYEFVKEELTEGTYDASNLIAEGSASDVIDRVLARDENDEQEFDPNTVGRIKQDVDAESHIYNRKPAVIITVEKEWDPDPEDGTTVTVKLHRYAKITKGTISVTLYDNNEAPIEGAVFALYKQGEDAETFTATGTEVTTNVNGIASVSGLEAGTYKLVQKSTPSGYSMEGHANETGILTVVDNVTTPQTLSESLTNTALVTAGKVTLTVTDSGAGSGTADTPIEGATFNLHKDGAVYNTGYRTNSEGKVVVGNLDAGVYCFVQTGTTADYKLPNVTRTENFTVEENPGVTQEFNQSITNSLKGKGTVSLTLSKDSGEAISGASFQLKSGNTILATASTESDGTLSFRTELYEGTYSVHQVNTGSAGDDYAVADDRTVTIDANSVTTQQKVLTFVNEEAAGNVTITMWKGDYGQYNQAQINPSITSLKAGVEYTFRIGGMPANNVDNGDTIKYTTSFIPGQAPNSLVTIPKSEWVKNEGTYYYDIT